MVEKKIVQFKINVKAHKILKKLAEKKGVPMAYVMRNYIYRGMYKELDEMQKKGELTWL